MAGFTLRKGTAEIEEWTITAGTAYYVGDLFDIDVGATTATITTSSSLCYTRKGVLAEDISTADDKINVQIVTSEQEWEVQSANNSAATDNNDAMVLTDHNTVNNTHTNSTAKEAVVTQIGVLGAAADKRILVKFTSTCSGLTHDAS